MSEKLSPGIYTEVERMTGIIARKIGYNTENGSAPGNVAQKMPQNSSLEQFSKEMNAFIIENIHDFMKKGLNEKEALIATQQKFSGEGFTKSLDEFFKKIGGVSEMQKPVLPRPNISKSFGLSVVPMLYIAFLLVGISFGIMIGKIAAMTVTGIICGALIGLGLGIIIHAVIILENHK